MTRKQIELDVSHLFASGANESRLVNLIESFVTNEKAKAIKLVKELRAKEDKAYEQCNFCKDHNFDLEAAKFKAVEDAYRHTCRMIENAFNTGYITAEK